MSTTATANGSIAVLCAVLACPPAAWTQTPAEDWRRVDTLAVGRRIVVTLANGDERIGAFHGAHADAVTLLVGRTSEVQQEQVVREADIRRRGAGCGSSSWPDSASRVGKAGTTTPTAPRGREGSRPGSTTCSTSSHRRPASSSASTARSPSSAGCRSCRRSGTTGWAISVRRRRWAWAGSGGSESPELQHSCADPGVAPTCYTSVLSSVIAGATRMPSAV
jgi:hypothetical protein